eukprot:1161021-Pelagomonas_calceolata.AAC.10
MGTQGEMDGVWRSENMQLVQLMIPAESAHDTVEALGDLGLLQFKDLNAEKSAFQRTYAPQVKRCEEMARKLRFFNEQVTKAGMKVAPQPVFAEQTITVDELEVLLERGGHFFDSARYQATQDSSTAMPTDASQDFSSPLLGPDQEAAVSSMCWPLRRAFSYCLILFPRVPAPMFDLMLEGQTFLGSEIKALPLKCYVL